MSILVTGGLEMHHPVMADPAKAKKELDWTAVRDLDEMCADSWKWQSENPNGYES